MFIAEITINNVPPFSGKVDFKFDKRVNVFIGPNASGKSTLLQQVLNNYRREWAGNGLAGTSEPEVAYINKQPVRLTSSEHCVFALEDHEGDGRYDRWGNYDVIIVPATRVRYGATLQKDGLMFDSEDHDFFGVESLSAVFYQDYIHSAISALQRIIEGNPVKGDAVPKDRERADHQLLHPFMVDAAEEDPRKAGRGLNEALVIAHECAKKICEEVISGNRPQNARIIHDVESESGLPEAKVTFELGVNIQTNDARNGRRVDPLDMASLSAGTEGTLWWTRLIALSLLFMNEFEPGWQKRRGILLIDEIENHLHPTWQRRVIPALLEHFPGLQIFATTHSPFVVAGLEKGQVHMLKRDANGAITATTNEHDIIGWTTDEILRTFMGVYEPTDQLTIDRRERLLELRRKDSLTDAEAAEMEELRRQVNEDFLSSSTPLETQRERYGDMMLEFLRSRQSELSQDGS